MLQNSFYAISGTFYTLLYNTDLYLSYFILSYVFLGHNDSVEWGLTVYSIHGIQPNPRLRIMNFNWFILQKLFVLIWPKLFSPQLWVTAQKFSKVFFLCFDSFPLKPALNRIKEKSFVEKNPIKMKIHRDW